MSLSLEISGLGIGSAVIGAVYSYLAPKFLTLSSTCISTQTKAFGVSAIIQSFFYYKDGNSTINGNSIRRNFIRYSIPYILIGGGSIYADTNLLKINFLSSAILGTAQIATCLLTDRFTDNWVDSSKFGASAWERHFGKVGPEPEIPEDMKKSLNDNCPFWPDKKIKETHILVLIPSTIDGNPFNLKKLSEIIKNPKCGYKTEFWISPEFTEQFKEEPIERSYWVLITKNIVPNSGGSENNNGFSIDQNRLFGERTYRYESPKVLEIATGILTHHVRRGHKLYKTEEKKRRFQLIAVEEKIFSTYTHCLEKPSLEDHSFVVGAFGNKALVALCKNKDFFNSNGFSQDTSRITYKIKSAGISAVQRSII